MQIDASPQENAVPAALPIAETGRLSLAKAPRRAPAADPAKERLQLRRRARSAGAGGGRYFQESTAPSALGALAGRTLTQLAAAGAGPDDEASARRRESGFVRCLELLLEKGLLELEVGDNWGLTPLLAASATGSTSTMAWLLEQQADLYATDGTRRNALVAIAKKQRKAVRFLCNYDADVSRLKQMQDWKGRRPEELWRTGWCTAAAGQEGLRQDFSTVWEAAREGDLDLGGGTPARAPHRSRRGAAEPGRLDGGDVRRRVREHGHILRLLLSLRCPLEAPDELPRRDVRPARGRSALHLAAEAGHADACELLVRAGAPVAAKSADGHTPVWAACSGGQLWALQSLVALRADPLCAAGGNALRALGSGDTERHADCIRWLTDLYCADVQGASKAELHQATDDATSFLELLEHGDLARPGFVARVHSPTHKALQRAVKAARRRCDALLKPL
ncbi:unnamed protein product [Prorocentrum cordatum]|uniref:Uncharacterized protein n=1 Tax=Prorocentrum cordatum TaxID=2364126 RepID=A0ABN9UAL9_9DINO|nr:unnamed protein product [Polarella glacialis]